MKDYEIWFKSFKEELEANGIDTSNPYFLSHILVNNNKPIPVDKNGNEFYFSEPNGAPLKDHLKKREELKDNVTYAFMEVDKKGRYRVPRPKSGTSVNWMVDNMKKFDEVSDDMKKRLFNMAKENKLYLREPSIDRDNRTDIRFIKVGPQNTCHVTIGMDQISCKKETLAKYAPTEQQRHDILNSSPNESAIDCNDVGFTDEEFAKAHFANISAFLLDRKLAESNAGLLQYYEDIPDDDKEKYIEGIKTEIMNDPLFAEKQVAVIGMLHPEWVNTPEKREEVAKVFGLQKLGGLATEEELDLLDSHKELSSDLPMYEKKLLKIAGCKSIAELMTSGRVARPNGDPIDTSNSQAFINDVVSSILDGDEGIALTNKNNEKAFYSLVGDSGLYLSIDRPLYHQQLKLLTNSNIPLPKVQNNQKESEENNLSEDVKLSKELVKFDSLLSQLDKYLSVYNTARCLGTHDILNNYKAITKASYDFLKSVEGRTDLNEYERSRIETAKLIPAFMELIEEAPLEINLDIIKAHKVFPRDLEAYQVNIDSTKNHLLEHGLSLKEIHNFLDASTKFFNDVKAFNTPDKHGLYKTVSSEALTSLKESYAAFKEALESAQKKGVYAETLRNITKLFPNNITDIEKIEADNLSSLPELLGRKLEIINDARKLNVDAEKGAMSSRIPISATLPLGEKQPGYFTVDEGFHRKDIKEYAAELDNKYKEYNGLFTRLYNQNMEELKSDNPETPLDMIDTMFKNMLDYQTLVENKTVNPNDSNIEGVLETVKLEITTLASFNAQYGETLMLEEGDSIAKRNVAFSNVADLLGLGKLVAHSKNMTILSDGVIKNGIFMEAATGTDINKLLPDDPLLNPNIKKIVDNDSVVKDMHSLQILDFLCFNLDRHKANILYDFKFDEKNNYVLCGIQGIDNDMSFAKCSVDAETSYSSNLPVFSYLKYIGKDLAERIKTISPEDLTKAITSAGLDEKTAKFACERLELIKERIIKNQLSPVEDGQWKDYHPNETVTLHKNTLDPLVNFDRNEEQKQKAEENLKKLKLNEGKKVNKETTELDLSDRSFVQSLYVQMKENMAKLNSVDRTFIRSSPQFRAMKKSMKAIENITLNVLKDTPEGKKVSDKQMQFIRCSYESLLHNCDNYLTTKQAVKKSDLSDYAKSRIQMATLIKDNISHVTQLMRKQDEMKTIELNKKQLEMAKNLSKIAKAKENLDKISTLNPEEITSNLKSLSEGANYFENEPSSANIMARDLIKTSIKYAVDNNITIEKETLKACEKSVELGNIAQGNKQVLDAMNINRKKENSVIDAPTNAV